MCRRGRVREREVKKERKGTTCTRGGRVEGGRKSGRREKEWKEGEREAEELGLVYSISSTYNYSFLHAANEESHYYTSQNCT